MPDASRSRTAARTHSHTKNPGKKDRLPRAVRAVAIASRLFEQCCQEHGVSLPQYRLLLWVRTGPRRAAELAERASVRRPTVTALVDGLVEQRLLRRTPVEGDRRGIQLELTEPGLEALNRVENALGALLTEITGTAGEDAVLDGLDELAGLLEAELGRRGSLDRS